MSRWRTLIFEFQAMASPCSLQLDGQDERQMRRAAQAAMDEVHRIEQKFSRYRADSVVSRINQHAGAELLEVDDETLQLLRFAAQLWQLSGGLFDITSGVLRQVWDFKLACLPDPTQLQAVLGRIGAEHVRIEGARVGLAQAGMELDFGGFGKEYAVDRAAMLLQQHGQHHALVNLGGDLYALGPRALPPHQGQAWQIDIQHPRSSPEQPHAHVAQLALQHGGLTTSGDYERYMTVDGQRYCHILNPRTGWPVRHWQSISVLAPTATAAGALSTIAMLKEAQALDWLDAQQAVYLAVRHDGQIFRRHAT